MYSTCNAKSRKVIAIKSILLEKLTLLEVQLSVNTMGLVTDASDRVA